MSENTAISWTDATFNPFIGCTKVSPGCDNCYAEVSTPVRIMRAKGVEAWGPHGQRRRTSAHNWRQPVAWNAGADAFEREHGRRRRVFCASLADVFDNAVNRQWRADLFELIAKTPRLDWLLLTKRIGNVGNMLPVPFDFDKHYPNVWLGISVVNQAEADRDIPKLLATPARVRFLSMEPLLGPVKLPWFCACGCRPPWELAVSAAMGGSSAMSRDQAEAAVDATIGVDWVIVGGESGPGARPMSPDWARVIRDQCKAAGVAFHFKQWGEFSLHEVDASGNIEPPMAMSFSGIQVSHGGQPFAEPAADAMAADVFRAGAVLAVPTKKAQAGRLLDGIEHNGFPS